MVMYIIIGVVVVLFVLVLVTYNSLIQLRNKVKEAFSTMDVYLKKRYDLIPNLVDIVKGCANFARLWGQPEWFVQLASDYAAARGADPQECIRLVLEARAKFWKPRARHFNLPYTLRF